MPPTAPQSSTPPRLLLDAHREHLRRSGLTDATIAAAGIYSVTDPTESARMLNWKGSDGPEPTIALPIYGIDGQVVQTVLRPDHPRTREDKSAAKYEQPAGEHHRVWYPPPALVGHSQLIDPAQPLIFVEGIKKALAAMQAGGVAISMQGVSTWHDAEHRKAHKGQPGEWKLHPDLSPALLKGRCIYVAFDGGDTTENPPVILAEARLARLLLDAGAVAKLLRLPFMAGGPKVGLDDFLARLPEAERASALVKLCADALPGDPLARVRALDQAEDAATSGLALVHDPSFAAAVSIADQASTDVIAAELRRVAKISKSALVSAVEGFRAGFRTETEKTSSDIAGPDVGPQDTTALLDDIAAAVSRHVWLPGLAPLIAIALWILHTWTIDAADYTPRLIIRSPAMRCGKSLLLDILAALCRSALVTANASAAALYRAIDQDRPTFLVDEADTFLADHEDLRGVLNAGYCRATGFALRCEKFEGDEGTEIKAVKFACFAPVAIAAIGRLPGTIEDRGIQAAMQRKGRDAKVTRFRRRERKAVEALTPRLRRWAADNLDALKVAEPPLPDALNDRLADVWEPLLAIADLAGGIWPSRARDAAVELAGAAEADGTTDRNLRLLAAVRAVFEPAPDPEKKDTSPPAPHERLSLESIVAALVDDTAAGWSEANRGKPITTSMVAKVLRGFGAGVAQQWRPGPGEAPPEKGDRVRGYYCKALAPIWARYFDPGAVEGDPARDGVTAQQPQGESRNPESVTGGARHESENAQEPNGEKGRHAVTPVEPPEGVATKSNGGGNPARGQRRLRL